MWASDGVTGFQVGYDCGCLHPVTLHTYKKGAKWDRQLTHLVKIY